VKIRELRIILKAIAIENIRMQPIPMPKLDSFSKDEQYMLRSIEIAKNGLGTTAPNPMVGAVIVYEDKIIGEGYTSPFGGAHAEVNAINSVTDKSLLAKSCLYVSLEPCSHHGKTPPCADLILKHNIPRVVIGLKDPHEKVAGEGIQKLLKAKCEVVTDVLKEYCAAHHKRFLTFHLKKRPFIILKWAETDDGFIAPDKALRATNPEPYWITGAPARQLVHKWRSEEQAILVGTTTVLEDNPRLDVRSWNGKSPVRIVLDANLKITKNYHVLDGSQRTIVFTKNDKMPVATNNVNYEVLQPENLAQDICDTLHHLNIQSVLVEGGAQTLQTFIDADLWDEARIFKGAVSFKNGVAAPVIKGRMISKQAIENDQLTFIKND